MSVAADAERRLNTQDNWRAQRQTENEPDFVSKHCELSC